MEHHVGKDVPPDERQELNLEIEGFKEAYVVRIKTALRPDEGNLREILNARYRESNKSRHSNLETGEGTTVEQFYDPIDEVLQEAYHSVNTELRTQNEFFTDVVTVAKLAAPTIERVTEGETTVGALGQQLDDFLTGLDTIGPRFRMTSDEETVSGQLDGLPCSSLFVAVPSSTPPIQLVEGNIDVDLGYKFLTDNKELLSSIGMTTSPLSTVVPESGSPFLLSTQPFSSPFGPYAAVYLDGWGNSLSEYPASLRELAGMESLVPLFRRFNWLRHRTTQVGRAEERVLMIDDQVPELDTGEDIDQKTLVSFEETIAELRSDISIFARLDEELRVLGNPYRETTSLATNISQTIPIPLKDPLRESLGDDPIANLESYAEAQEPFLANLVERTQERQRTARDSLLAEASILSTRQNLAYQANLTTLTRVLAILTVVMAAPIIVDFCQWLVRIVRSMPFSF